MSPATFSPGARFTLAALSAGQPVSIDRLIVLRVELLVCLQRIRDKKARSDLLAVEDAIQQRHRLTLEWHDIGEPEVIPYLDFDVGERYDENHCSA